VADLKTWFLETRPSFLLLVPVCVFTGAAASLYDGYPFRPLYFALAFIGALFAHISVNVLNEYSDYRTGIDFRTQRTPFSGGSGLLPAGLLKPAQALMLGLGSLTITVAIGIYFAVIYTWAILPLGIVGVLIILLYTPYLTKLPGITELVGPGLGFGLMVLGTYVVQSGDYRVSSVLVSLVAGLLIANLLLINEFPDVEADRPAGRKHLPIIIGRAKSAWVYCVIAVLAYAVIIVGVAIGSLPLWALLGLATLPLVVKAMAGALKHHSDMPGLMPALEMNVMSVLLTPTLMSVGIIIAAYAFD
jgi:1,4-dihydroxy-2-naphthoate octaprenyltransferase